MITAVIGTTSSATDGAATLTPSIAESTEIAGVMMLSPKNSDAPDAEHRQHGEPQAHDRPEHAPYGARAQPLNTEQDHDDRHRDRDDKTGH